METREFKRAVHLTLNPKLAKEGFKSVLRKRRDVNVGISVLQTVTSVGRLMAGFQPYIAPGVQLNDKFRAQAKIDIGNVLHHGVVLAKLIKAKVPGSQKKIKVKNTPTFLLTEIDRCAANLLETYVSSITAAKAVPMTEEEKVAATAAYTKRVEAAKAKHAAAPATTKGKDKDGKEIDVPKGEFKAPATPDYTKVVGGEINAELMKSQVSALLLVVAEFSWAMLHAPIAEAMAAHIEAIKPNFPEGFFTPPPKKPAPTGLVPRKKKDAAEVVAKAESAPAAK